MTLIYNYLNIIIQKDLKGIDGETKGISLMNTKLNKRSAFFIITPDLI